jgi:adenylate kinase family enzyme
MPNYITDADTVAAVLRAADRVMVIGCSGGGKSTLSQAIAVRFDLVYISIDRDIRWLPGWQQRSREEERQRFVERIAEDRWVMDGTSPSSFDIRVPRSDVIVWVRMPRLLCVWGVVTRWLKFFGRTRPEMAPGCIEKVDLEFLEFIWTFERKYTPHIVAEIATHGPNVPVFQLKSRREMRQLLDLLGSAD